VNPDWIETWSATAYDLAWNPVPIVAGRLRTDHGVRFALLVDGRHLAIFVPGVDRELVTHAHTFVEAREEGGQQ
jgi:hypothetical protein